MDKQGNVSTYTPDSLLTSSSEGDNLDQDQRKGLSAQLWEGLFHASSVKAQADAMDSFKERLKALAKEAASITSVPPSSFSRKELEGTYAAMLQLYLDPRGVMLKKVLLLHT